ncbi:hypothetical protein V6N13_049066 [Hibiscus sabdariffa]
MCSTICMPSPARLGVCCEPPTYGELKFIVDGYAHGKPGPTGFGRVLRDEHGLVVCVLCVVRLYGALIWGLACFGMDGGVLGLPL